DMEQNKGASSLWLLSAFGGEPRRLTTAGDKDAEPRWSPDGRWIAFVAKRALSGEKPDEEAQGYVIAPDGGEARRVTSVPTGAFAIKWFPDSRRLAFASWVWPEEPNLKALEKRYRAWKDDKVKAYVVEHSAYRWWDHWLSDGRVPHLFVVDVDSGAIRDLFAGTRYELPRNDPAAHHYDIAPDGREVAFTFDPASDKRFDHANQIVALELASRRFRTLTARSALNPESPAYSPDGTRIAFVAQDQRRSPIAAHKLAFIDRKRGGLEVVRTRWDRSIHAPLAWGSDDNVYFHAEDNARAHLYRWTVGEKAPHVVAEGGTVTDFDVAGEAVAFVRSSMSTPPAGVRRGAGGGGGRARALHGGGVGGGGEGRGGGV